MFLEGIDDFQDEHRVVGNDMQLHARRQLGPQPVFDLVLDLVDDGDGIGVGDLDDAQADGHFAVEAGELAIVGEAVDDFGDILQLDRAPPFQATTIVFQAVEAVEFEVELDQALGFSPTTKPPASWTCSC